MMPLHIFIVFALALAIGALLCVLQPALAVTDAETGKARRLPLLLGLSLPLCALLVYLLLGRPDLINAQAAGAAKPARAISGTVALAPVLQQALPETATLYVFARAVQGPPLPLAVFKTRVQSWPRTFTLDDSMAVMGDARLSDMQQVTLVARISRNGQAIGQPGDIESAPLLVTVGARDVQLTLDRIRP